MRERFVSEALKPVTATCDTSRMAVGEPGLPLEFSWHDETIRISEVLRTWRETGKCRNGSGEDYVRKHWFEVRTAGPRRETSSSRPSFIFASTSSSILLSRISSPSGFQQRGR